MPACDRGSQPEAAPSETGRDLAEAIERPRDGGQPLAGDVRRQMEGALGLNFADVRLHTGPEADVLSRALSARAFTSGRDVFFRMGEYNPGSASGRGLLAHELTHVVQQSGETRRTADGQAAPDAVEERVDQAVPSGVQRQADDSTPAGQTPAATDEAPSPDTGEDDDSGAVAETVDQPAEDEYVSEDSAPEEEQAASEEGPGPVEGEVATSPEGQPPAAVARLIVPPSDPSEREAEVVGRAVAADSEVGGCLSAGPTSGGRRHIQRQVYYDDRSQLTWADFKSTAPKGSPFAAQTYSGFKFSGLKNETSVNPYYGGQFTGLVSLELPKNNPRAYMQPGQSWVKSAAQTAILLDHEQGHFDISHVVAGKVEWAITLWAIQNVGRAEKSSAKAAQNAAIVAWNKLHPSTVVNDFVKKGVALHKKVQKAYDDETIHGTQAGQQATWRGDLTADLPGYPLS